jgi:WD40 repeat protein
LVDGWHAQLWDIDANTKLAALDPGKDGQIRSFKSESVSVTGRESDEALSGSFSRDGKLLLTTGIARDHHMDRWFPTLCVWDAATGKPVSRLRHDPGIIKHAAFSPDGRRIVTAHVNEGLIWEAETGKKLLSLKGHTGQATWAAFSPDGRRVVTASEDRTARLWDAVTSKELFVLKGHDGGIGCVAFHPDGKLVATACVADKTVRLWDAVTGKEVATLKGSPYAKYDSAMGISSDGKWVFASSASSARLWPIDLLSAARARKPRELTPEERERFEIGAVDRP